MARSLAAAVDMWEVRTSAWLRAEAGCPLHAELFALASQRGDLPMVRWLLQAGCPRLGYLLSTFIDVWPLRAVRAAGGGGAAAGGGGLLAGDAACG